MTRLFGVAAALLLTVGLTGAARALAEDDATAVVDKAIQALGGEEKLGKLKAASWSTKGTISFNGSDNPVSMHFTAQGLDHVRTEFEGEFGGMEIKAVTVLAGDKGWRSFGGNVTPLDKDALAGEKRTAYLTLVPVILLPLKGSEFKLAAAADEQVNGKPAAVIQVTAPDGKDFKLYFDKESGLPVRLIAKVLGFMGDEFTQDTTFSDYKEMGGVRRASKISSKRDGEKFTDQ